MPSFVGVFSGTTVDTEESVTGAILNVEKKLVFPSNTNIDDIDRFTFVTSEEECLNPSTVFQNINNEASVLYLSVLRTSEDEVNTQLYGCMKFGNEPAMFLSSVMITVKKFTGIESIDGDNYESNINKKLNLANFTNHKDRMISELSGGEFKLIQIIKEMLNNPDLLIMADHGIPAISSVKEFVDQCNRILVIDHHRRSDAFVKNTLLTYVESSASSACELIVELLQENLSM